MIMVSAFFLGGLIGAIRTYKKQGSRLDMLQYGAVYGIIFFIIGLFATIAIGWLGWV